MQHVRRGHRHFGQIQPGEDQRSVRVDHRLLINFRHALNGTYEVGILAQQVPGMRRFDVLLGIDQPTVRLAQTSASALRSARRRGRRSAVPATAGAGSAPPVCVATTHSAPLIRAGSVIDRVLRHRA